MAPLAAHKALVAESGEASPLATRKALVPTAAAEGQLLETTTSPAGGGIEGLSQYFSMVETSEFGDIPWVVT